jgi:hypothetical protein
MRVELSERQSAKKRFERGLLDRARRLSGIFPADQPVDREEPDFLFEFERLGVETTQLFHSKGDALFPRRQVESFHRSVMQRAEGMARAQVLPPLNVLAYFNEQESLRDLDAAAASLVTFVREHPTTDCETHTWPLPSGFGVVRILALSHDAQPTWRCSETAYVPRLDYDFLASTISSKNARLGSYRMRADRVWLLIAAELFPLSSSFSVPPEIENWTFPFEFDKVLLLSGEDGRVFELKRASG